MAHARSSTGRTNLLFFFFFSASVQDNNFFFSQCRKREDITSLWMAAPPAVPTASPAAESLISKKGQHRRCLSLPAASSRAAQSPELSQARVHPVPLSCCLPALDSRFAPRLLGVLAPAIWAKKMGSVGGIKALQWALRHLWTGTHLAGWRRAVAQVKVLLSALALLPPNSNLSYF